MGKISRGIKKAILLFSLMLFLPSIVHSKTVKLGYVEFPPMTHTNENGKPDGKIILLAEKVLENAGFKWQAVSLPTNRMVAMLIEGRIDMWIGVSTIPALKETTLVGESVVDIISLRAYSFEKGQAIQTKKDLKGKRILVLRGYSYGGWINYIKDPANKIDHLEFDSHEIAFKRLRLFSARGRKSWLLDYKYPSETAINKLNITNISSTEISALNIYFVVSKNIAGAKSLLLNLETSYRNLVDKGILKTPKPGNKRI